MEDRLREIFIPYNPWWDSVRGIWREDIPSFQRTIVERVISDIEELPPIVSVTGPRRVGVGKTTALRQEICYLLDNKSIAPERVLYFSFDDPEIFVSSELQREIFDKLVTYAKEKGATKEAPCYFFS
jgi:predicted AAA+ superfamily ATPase